MRVLHIIILIYQLLHIKFCICNDGEETLAKAVNQFSYTLYDELAKQDGNVVFSGFSVHAALSLLAVGASGKTQEELLSKLMVTDLETIESAYSRITSHNNPQVTVAYNLYISRIVSLVDEFKLIAKHAFQVEPQQVDFTDKEMAVSLMNEWVSSKTNNKIPKMVGDDFVDAKTVLVLLNVLYFKGIWALKFNNSETIPDYVFHSPEGAVKCAMMVMKDRQQRYKSVKGFRLLELGFQDSNLKIVFAIPDDEEHTALQVMKDDIKTITLEELLATAFTVLKDIYIPKFKLDKDYGLEEYLRAIGITDIFENPDFSKLYEFNENAKVHKIQQKTHIEINEDGVEAAVATDIENGDRGPDPQFILDRPFLFFLYDTASKIIVMQGRVDNPNE